MVGASKKGESHTGKLVDFRLHDSKYGNSVSVQYDEITDLLQGKIAI
jgi:hypothetical protein